MARVLTPLRALAKVKAEALSLQLQTAMEISTTGPPLMGVGMVDVALRNVDRRRTSIKRMLTG